MSQSRFNCYKLPMKAMHFSWFYSWMISWLIAFPAVLIILPIARRLSLMFVRQPITE